MAFHCLPDGSLVTDTLEEALAFQDARKKPKQTKAWHSQPKTTTSPDDLWMGWDGFCRRLQGAPDARKILALIKGRGVPGFTIPELSAAVSLSVGVIAGTLSGISKKAKKSGLVPSDVIVRGRGGFLAPGPLLLENTPPTP